MPRHRNTVQWIGIALTCAIAAAPIVACDHPSNKMAPAASSSAAASAQASSAPLPTTPMNAIPIPSASVAAMVNPSNLPAYSGPTGSIEGTITVTGDPAPDTHLDYSKCPDGAAVYGKLFREGKPGPNGARPIADAIVGVIDVGDSKFYVPERKPAERVDIVDCALTKRTITMTFGQRLEVANKTKGIFAPQFSTVSMPALMLAPTDGDAVKLYPPKPGRYMLIDRMGHDYLTGDVFAFLFSLHDATNLDGHYRIDGVPIGKRKVFATHPSFQGVDPAKEIDVLEGVVHRVDLTLTYGAPKPVDAGVGAAADGGKIRLILK